MIDAPRWFDRTFAFPYPAELLPLVLTRLRGAPARLDEALLGTPLARRTRNAPGGWSAQEHAGHLADLEPLWLARVEDLLGASHQLTPADLTNRATTEAGHNTRELGAILKDFSSGRARLLERVRHLNALQLSHSLPHPRMKTPMTIVDHLFFVAEHDDHHLMRIWTLLNEDAS
jgi:uncharacterized damage-inducible protein DinB